MKKKKKGGVIPAKNSAKGKSGKKAQIAELMKEHPSLEREDALEIVDAGISFEEWEQKKEEEREARRLANQKRMVAMICSQYSELSEKEALQIINENISPEEFMARRAAEKKRALQQQSKKRGRAPSKPPPKSKKRPVRPSKVDEKKARLDELTQKHPEISRAVAGQILREGISVQEFMERNANKKRKSLSTRTIEERAQAKELQEQRMKVLAERLENEAHLGASGDEYLEKLKERQKSVRVWRFHAPSFGGLVAEIRPLMLVLQTEHQEALRLRKLGCVLLYLEEDEENIQQQIQVDLSQLALLQHPPREPKNRYEIPAEWTEIGKTVSLQTHDGLELSGVVEWADRFQLLLKLPAEGHVFVFRHSVTQATEGESSFGDNLLSFHQLINEKPSLPEVHPEELPLEQIVIPVQFDDYDVRDKRYREISDMFDAGKFQLHPIRIRREGEQYVLLDGYRRLTLAREKELAKIPVRVI